jgi:hypothetical protein
MSDHIYPTGTWESGSGDLRRTHIFKDANRDETFCGVRRFDRPLIYDSNGPCKICEHLVKVQGKPDDLAG